MENAATSVKTTEPMVPAPPAADTLNRTYAEKAEELENLYQAAPVGLALMDRNFRFLRINERLANINGKPVGEHIGHTLGEIVPEPPPGVPGEGTRSGPP